MSGLTRALNPGNLVRR